MFFIFSILIVYLAFLYEIKKKRPELKGKVNFIILTPIISLLLSLNIITPIGAFLDNETMDFLVEAYLYNGGATCSFIDEHAAEIAGCQTIAIIGVFLWIGWMGLLYRSLTKKTNWLDKSFILLVR